MTSADRERPPGRARQAATGLGLAGAIVAGWLIIHVTAVFVLPLDPYVLAAAPLIVAIQTVLSVGLFIVAHDAMHGSLAPFRPRLNAAIGRFCLFIYAGFSFDALKLKHMRHHAAPGTADDPDYCVARPDSFMRWYRQFYREYFGLKEFAILTAILAVYVGALGAPVANLLLFWALPALLSSLQLFYFGTYRPHRPRSGDTFADGHHARSVDLPPMLSLITCFHFGYHHEHHLYPQEPWWRLPAVRRARLAEAGDGPAEAA